MHRRGRRLRLGRRCRWRPPLVFWPSHRDRRPRPAESVASHIRPAVGVGRPLLERLGRGVRLCQTSLQHVHGALGLEIPLAGPLRLDLDGLARGAGVGRQRHRRRQRRRQVGCAGVDLVAQAGAGGRVLGGSREREDNRGLGARIAGASAGTRGWAVRRAEGRFSRRGERRVGAVSVQAPVKPAVKRTGRIFFGPAARHVSPRGRRGASAGAATTAAASGEKRALFPVSQLQSATVTDVGRTTDANRRE